MTWTSFTNKFLHICASFCYLNSSKIANKSDGVQATVLVSWQSEATPSATLFFKRAYKISHPPRLWVSWIDLPSFASSSKIWPNFSNKVFFSWSYEKVILTKNVRLTYYSSMKKKIQKDSDDFWHRKFTLKVQFLHFAPSWQS